MSQNLALTLQEKFTHKLSYDLHDLYSEIPEDAIADLRKCIKDAMREFQSYTGPFFKMMDTSAKAETLNGLIRSAIKLNSSESNYTIHDNGNPNTFYVVIGNCWLWTKKVGKNLKPKINNTEQAKSYCNNQPDLFDFEGNTPDKTLVLGYMVDDLWSRIENIFIIQATNEGKQINWAIPVDDDSLEQPVFITTDETQIFKIKKK